MNTTAESTTAPSGLQASAAERGDQTPNPEPIPSRSLPAPDKPGIWHVVWSNRVEETVRIFLESDGELWWKAKSGQCFPVKNGHLGKWRRA